MVMVDVKRVERVACDVRTVCDHHGVKRMEMLVAWRIARVVCIGARRKEMVLFANHDAKRTEKADVRRTETARGRTMECDHHDARRMVMADVRWIARAVCIGAKKMEKVLCDHHDEKRMATADVRRIVRAVCIGAKKMEKVLCGHHDEKRMATADVRRIVRAVCTGARKTEREVCD